MLQHMDSMEASCLFYVNVVMLNLLEHSQISHVTVNTAGIVIPTAQHDLFVSVSLIYYPGDFLRQTSADVLSLKEHPMNI
jgi:hypothetical protein